MADILRIVRELANPLEFIRIVVKNTRILYWTGYLTSKGVQVGKNISLKGKPQILKFKGAIRIGDNVTIRSGDYGYHSSIYAPTRLMTDTTEHALIEIGDNTRINGASIHAAERITIGRDCLIAANVTIVDSDGHGLRPDERHLVNPVSRPVIIEDNVWIGLNSIILKGVRIGANSVIGAGSVVSRDVPPNCVASGNPAQVVKTFDL
ncbi:MAG: acyltransferase [Desulfuromonadales bacterium]|nr:MAG: acyltransferase [Desulfuromonadales bacterium]